MKKVAVILSGCGVFDGSEVNEAILTLLSLEEQGLSYNCFAPSMDFNSVNHIDNTEGDVRNVLVESARLTRGHISPLESLNVDDFQSLVVVGGFGVAKNLSNFAKGLDFEILPSFKEILCNFKKRKKWVGLMCIAPIVLPFIYKKPICTIGHCKDTSLFIERNGGTHVECEVVNIVCDNDNHIVTTPAYMLARNIIEAKEGINKLISKLAREIK
ncbi:isoprenoid biosynthesis glyoxalase ElbB [Candidatus Enterovibrio escicola]|uniref:Sigma cross-reacting protein 27A n=1 Tax=Candidatus Enterovibrio escicola TaxID=1927127 RepID=A0A2A5T4I5_9GAMM|nr:isoprenoid biosynthesis glyoxalase ElbB [Candidatus Enterovibrio escacola]PCS23064.1 Sigma cross-reacting protein 27A [Candidatus Enterovibrio escacola]